MSETCSRAHLENQRRARPSDARRSAAHARSAGTSVVDLREERASDVRRDPPAARRSQPTMVLEMRPGTGFRTRRLYAGATPARAMLRSPDVRADWQARP